MNYLSPLFNEQTFDDNGDPLVGGKIYTYIAGTSTPLATYTTQNGVTQQANPIILDARGEPTNPIWLGAQEYKFVLNDASDNLIRTIDDVSGVNNTSVDQSEWQASVLTPTYISATSFSFAGDQTLIFAVGRRVRTENTGGTVYSTITSSSFGAGITTIVVRNDSGVLDSGLSVVSYGVLAPTNSSIPNSQDVRQTMGIGYGIDIASAAALPLSTVTGEVVRVTGTVATTSATMTNGQRIKCIAVGAWPLTYNATTMPLPGSADYTCAAGDMVIFTKNGNGDLTVEIIKRDGTAVVSPAAQVFSRGYIDGCIMSTAGSSATMTVAAGQAADSTNALFISLAASIAKTTSAWAVGTGNGGIDTGAIANSTWYYFYLIRRPDTGVVDVIFSLSSSAPTLPANYTQYRYIGAGLTNGSAQWVKFYQNGNDFWWDTAVFDLNTGASGTTSTLLTTTIPRGRKMKWYGKGAMQSSGLIRDPASADVVPAISSGTANIVGVASGTSQISVWSNTSAQVAYRAVSNGTAYISTDGWMDLRGADA